MNKKTNDPVVTKSILDKSIKDLKKELEISIEIMGASLRTEMDEKFEKQNQLILDLHSKMMNRFDEMAGEIKSSREERTVSGSHISANTQRIDNLEQEVFGSVQTS